MKATLAIARLTCVELIRDRFVLLLGFLLVFLLVLSVFLGTLSLDEEKRLLIHLGFASFQLTLVGLALFLGSSLLQKELDRQTCLLVLSRPLSRWQFLFGKFLGVCALISFFWLMAGVCHFALLKAAVDPELYLWAQASLLIESGFILSLAFCLATFLRPLLAMASTFVIWLAGHGRPDLFFFAKKSGEAYFQFAAKMGEWILPPLDRLDIRTEHFLTSGQPFELIPSFLHLFFWSTLLLFFAQLIWRRKDLV